jgi:hypothetical protein
MTENDLGQSKERRLEASFRRRPSPDDRARARICISSFVLSFFLCCGIFSIIKLLSAAVVCPGHRMTGISSEFYRAIARNGSRPVEILPNSCIFLGVLTGSCLLLHHHFLCSGFGGMFRIDELNQVKNTCTSFCVVIL